MTYSGVGCKTIKKNEKQLVDIFALINSVTIGGVLQHLAIKAPNALPFHTSKWLFNQWGYRVRVSTCLADLLRTVTLKSVKLITVNRACIAVKQIHSANYICLISLLINKMLPVLCQDTELLCCIQFNPKIFNVKIFWSSLHKVQLTPSLCGCFRDLKLSSLPSILEKKAKGENERKRNRNWMDICVAFPSWCVLLSIKKEWGQRWSEEITHYIHTQAQKKNKKLVRLNQTYTSQVDFSRELKLAAANSTAPGYFGCQPALTGWLTAKGLMLDVCGCPGPAPVLTGELHYPRQIVSQMWANIYYRLAGWLTGFKEHHQPRKRS